MAAFENDALWSKSKIFVDRALHARDNSDDMAFHLWASFASSYWGRLRSPIHPTLVADPSHFRTSSLHVDTRPRSLVKSISAKTLTFERLRTTCEEFDQRMFRECMTMASRRNTELHSGDSPVARLDARSWVPNFWRAVSVLLSHPGPDAAGLGLATRKLSVRRRSSTTQPRPLHKAY